jgi:hypothetical protein
MRAQLRVYLVVVAIFFVSCKESGKKAKDTASGGGGANIAVLPAGDDYNQFRSLISVDKISFPASVSEIDANEVRESIDAESSFFYRPPRTPDGPCVVLTFSVPVRASASIMMLHAKIDWTHCLRSESKPMNTESASAELLLQRHCENGNFQQYDGRPASEVQYVECATGTERKMSSSIVTYKGYTFPNTTTKLDVTSYLYYGNRNGSFCTRTFSSGEIRHQDCVEVSRTEYLNVVDPQASSNVFPTFYSLLDFAGTVAQSGVSEGSYYKSGFVNFQINDWTNGRMTYNGVNVAPTWQISRGSENLNGTFQYQASSLSLIEGAAYSLSRDLMDKFWRY